jgi:hypothetical protein
LPRLGSSQSGFREAWPISRPDRPAGMTGRDVETTEACFRDLPALRQGAELPCARGL